MDLLADVLEANRRAKLAREAAAVADDPAAIARLRRASGLSQPAFARALGLSVHTVQNWEEGRRHPNLAARALLRLVASDPGLLRARRPR